MATKVLQKGVQLCVPKTPHMFKNSTDQLGVLATLPLDAHEEQSSQNLVTSTIQGSNCLPMCQSPTVI